MIKIKTVIVPSDQSHYFLRIGHCHTKLTGVYVQLVKLNTVQSVLYKYLEVVIHERIASCHKFLDSSWAQGQSFDKYTNFSFDIKTRLWENTP